jgi:hypothetical protein
MGRAVAVGGVVFFWNLFEISHEVTFFPTPSLISMLRNLMLSVYKVYMYPIGTYRYLKTKLAYIRD